MNMKRLLMIATGGTIASQYTEDGLCPQIESDALLSYVPGYEQFCAVDVVQPFNLDSTNIYAKQWIILEDIIEKNYSDYDGFIICHGTDTMAYTAAALSYLIQNSKKPIVITGAQKPIDLNITDARTNLMDSLRFASHDRAHGVNIVFGGVVICGTRAKKERSKSYNAFSSINYPQIAVIQDHRIIFYIDDKKEEDEVTFYHELNDNVFLLKLIPGIDGSILKALSGMYDAIVIESFGVGGLPSYEEDNFYKAILRCVKRGTMVVMATQVTHEGSDMDIYQVGKTMKREFHLPESYDMTLEAVVAKTMWALAQKDKDFMELFYKTINHDMLFFEENN